MTPRCNWCRSVHEIACGSIFACRAHRPVAALLCGICVLPYAPTGLSGRWLVMGMCIFFLLLAPSVLTLLERQENAHVRRSPARKRLDILFNFLQVRCISPSAVTSDHSIVSLTLPELQRSAVPFVRYCRCASLWRHFSTTAIATSVGPREGST